MSEKHFLKEKLIFVMGGGKFGTNALRYFTDKDAKVLVADINHDCLAHSQVNFISDQIDVFDSLVGGQSALVIGDAVEILLATIKRHNLDLLVTAIRGNAIAKIVEVYVTKHGKKFEPYTSAFSEVLKSIPESLVSFTDNDSATIVVSYMPANLRCRENCFPPKGFCPETGRLKQATMYKRLMFSIFGLTDVSGVLMSKQFTGGLGAIEGKDLLSLLKQLDNIKSPYIIAVGSACDCHGIINLAKIK